MENETDFKRKSDELNNLRANIETLQQNLGEQLNVRKDLETQIRRLQEEKMKCLKKLEGDIARRATSASGDVDPRNDVLEAAEKLSKTNKSMPSTLAAADSMLDRLFDDVIRIVDVHMGRSRREQSSDETETTTTTNNNPLYSNVNNDNNK